MADDKPRKQTVLFSGAASVPIARDPRSAVVVPVRYRYQSFIEFIETQSINISRSGMFVASDTPMPAGTKVEFEFSLSDGFPLLRGRAEVVRVSERPRGMGMRFSDLDEPSRQLIERIVQVNIEEGKQPAVSLDFDRPEPSLSQPTAPPLRGATGVRTGVVFQGSELRVEVTPATAGFFNNNPLLNIRLGGFVVPGPPEAALGQMFEVILHDMGGNIFWSGKGKVVAKHESRVGVRLADVPKDVLGRLQAEITRLTGK